MRRPTSCRRAWLVACSLAVATAACGTRIDPGAARSTAPRRGSGSPSTLATTTDEPPTSVGASAPSTGGGPAPTEAAVPSSGGAGVTASDIRIGINYIDSQVQNQQGVSFGDKGSSNVSDPTAQVKAVVAYLNQNGGLAGRRVVPVFFDSNDQSNFDAQDQAACAHFTQDEHVFAVASVGVGFTTLAHCLAKAQTPLVRDFYGTLADQTDLAQLHGFFYQPDGLRGERLGAAWVANLASAGYFDSGAKVGLVYFDNAEVDRVVAGTIEPALQARGVQVRDEAKLSANGISDFGKVATDLAAAVLRFNSKGVDHVMFFNTAGLAPFLFAPQAAAQLYRPRYAMTSLDFPAALASEIAPSQLHGSVITGWIPTFDVGAAQDPGPNATARLCDGIYQRAQLRMQSRQDESQALRWCGQLLLLKAALDHAPSTSAAGLLAAVDALGTTYQVPGILATSFGPGREDGAAAVEAARFDDGCSCYAYSGPLQAVP